MTNIYIYCLFDSTKRESFKGVYSSIKAVHRDALKLANRGQTQVMMYHEGKVIEPTVSNLRNTNRSIVTIYKTRLKE